MERREFLEVLAHVVFLKLFEKRDNTLIVCRFRRELYALFREPVAVEGAELFVVCDVEEVDVLLVGVSGVPEILMYDPQT